MDTAPPPLPPESSPPLDSLPHQRDLYCLQCGYNLRGLAGDPLRCPECGGSNPVGLIEVPAELISQHIKRMESALATATLCGLVSLPFALLFVVAYFDGARPDIICVGFPLLAGTIGMVGAMILFAELTGRRPGWLSGAFRYFGIATLMAALVIGIIWLAAHGASRGLNFSRDGTSIPYTLTMVAATIALIAVIRWAVPPLRERLLNTIEPMRRGIATSVTREYLRSQQGHARRTLGL